MAQLFHLESEEEEMGVPSSKLTLLGASFLLLLFLASPQLFGNFFEFYERKERYLTLYVT